MIGRDSNVFVWACVYVSLAVAQMFSKFVTQYSIFYT